MSPDVLGRVAVQFAAVICLLVGLATLWLPIPTGLVLIVIGLSLLIMSSRYMSAWLRFLRRRYEGLNAQLNRTEPYLPKPLQRALAKTKARR